MKKLRILVADDHALIRRGVRGLLETNANWTVCGEAADGRSAVQKAIALKPDVVIIDLTMPGLNGLDASRKILRALPATEIIVLTVHESDQVVRDVLTAGARGYVLKCDAERDIIAAVDAVTDGRTFFSPSVSERVLEGYLKQAATKSNPRIAAHLLTPREREILQLAAEGKTNKQIALDLGISLKTTEIHRGNIKKKLHLGSLTDLVRYAIRNKIIET